MKLKRTTATRLKPPTELKSHSLSPCLLSYGNSKNPRIKEGCLCQTKTINIMEKIFLLIRDSEPILCFTAFSEMEIAKGITLHYGAVESFVDKMDDKEIHALVYYEDRKEHRYFQVIELPFIQIPKP
jgi:hypothetical protein